MELVRLRTEDGVQLAGLLYSPAGARNRRIGILPVHGTNGNFYTNVAGFLPPMMAERGYTGLSMNLRNQSHLYATSLFEDCIADIRAGIARLTGEGCERIVLVGHSLGATEVVYYLAQTRDPAVAATVLMGAHFDLRGTTSTFFKATDPEDPIGAYDRMIAECRRLVDEGLGENLVIFPQGMPDPKLNLPVKWNVQSAASFLSYRAPESACNASAWIGEVRTPLLFAAHPIANTGARVEFSEQLLALATGSPRAELRLVPGANHFYTGVEAEATSVIAAWLEELGL